VTEAPGRAVRTPDSLLHGLVSTVLTSTGPASVRPAEIVGIPRFYLGVRHRFGVDISTMDTDTPQSLSAGPCPTVEPPHVAGVRSRGRSLHSHARPPALHEPRVYCMGVGGSCSTHNPRPVPPDPRAV